MVELKKKVTLKAKTPSKPSPTDGGGIQPHGGGTESPKGGAGKWIAIIVVILVVAGLVYYFTQKNGGDGTAAQQDSTLVSDSTQSEKADSMAENSDSTAEASDGKAASETEVPVGGDDVNGTGSEAKAGAVTKQPAATNLTAESTEDNEITSSEATVSGSVEELAWKVIRGKYGNGSVRKQNLGSRYGEVQGCVNEVYRKGLVN